MHRYMVAGVLSGWMSHLRTEDDRGRGAQTPTAILRVGAGMAVRQEKHDVCMRASHGDVSVGRAETMRGHLVCAMTEHAGTLGSFTLNV